MIYSIGLTNEGKKDIRTAMDYYRQARDIDPQNPHYDRKIKGLLKQML